MNSKIIISAFVLGLIVTACGGGDSPSTTVDTTVSLKLDSTTEAGSSDDFSALLLHRLFGNTSNTTGIVLLHGRGGNPDSAVVRQLRKDLYSRGYSTLSIQEAVPATFVEGDSLNQPPFSAYVTDAIGANSVFLETYARVRTAINALESRGMTQVVVIGFSMGSRIAAAHVARGQDDELPIIGLVGIGMYAGASDPYPLKTTLTLAEVMNIPVLDIYGDQDTASASTADARKAAYGGSVANYTQISLSCDVVLSTNDCHKLVNLKGSPSSPLELAVSNWIANL